ncbi:MAG: NrfD/PsrC family molybdoenzyme membrane anchor subunit [Nitrospinota bacterium]
MSSSETPRQGDGALFEPIGRTTSAYYLTVAGLLLLVGWGVASYVYQWVYGLGVTGLNRPVAWGFYITNFVFFIGISHAGTLISAILRLSHAEWRRPITRMAEVITVVVLGIGGMNILVDLGRPDRALNVLLQGRYQSPLLWDATSISAYLTASTIYLWLPMIPDLAMLRDRGRRWRWLYGVLALGWTGTERQHRVLNRAVAIMAVMVIPIAVSVHSVVSFVFSMTLQPGWHSTIFGPYFVVGAIFSGIAALIITMIVIRRIYHLERYLKPVHFRNLGTLLLLMSLLWFYFTFAEYLTGYYGNEPEEVGIMWSKFNGPFAPFFWGMVIANFVVPVLVLSFWRTIPGTFIASVTALIGMWVERYIIIVPTLSHPLLPQDVWAYLPSIIELGETVGSFALFVLMFAVFIKLFPIISVWEIQEGREEALEVTTKRILSYLPDESLQGQT